MIRNINIKKILKNPLLGKEIRYLNATKYISDKIRKLKISTIYEDFILYKTDYTVIFEYCISEKNLNCLDIFYKYLKDYHKISDTDAENIIKTSFNFINIKYLNKISILEINK